MQTGVQQQQQIQQNFLKLGPKSTSSEYVSKNQRAYTIGKWLEDSKIKDSLRCFEADGDQMKRLSLTIFQAS